MTDERTERIALKQNIEDNINCLIKHYRDCLNEGKGYKETFERFVNEIGNDKAYTTIAELINLVGDWDERIDTKQRCWAKSMPNALSRDELKELQIFLPSEIHQTHIDQIGEYARRQYIWQTPILE